MIPPDHTRVSRLVVRVPNWLGDAVMALPALAALRRHFADARLTIAGPRSVAALFHEQTEARPDHVLELPPDRREAVAMLRGEQAELGVLFPNSFAGAWQLRRAGIAQRWGYNTSGRGWLLTRAAVRVPSTGPVHQADYYRNLVRGLGIPCGDEAPSVLPASDGVSLAATRLGITSPADLRLVLFAPGAAYGQAKQWSPTRVAGVMARLAAERDATCVLVGAAHDRRAGREIEEWLRAHAVATLPRVHNLIGRTSLRDLVALAAASRVCVTNDSGAMHVAAATGRPVVALFGPTDERVTRPIGRGDVLTADAFCRPCHLRDCPIDHRCMKRITVDTVFAAVSRHLAFAGSRT